MVGFRSNTIFDLVKISIFVKVILLCSIFIFPLNNFAQSKTQNRASQTTIVAKEPPKEQEMPTLFNPENPILSVDPTEPISMEFTLEWTNYQAHRVNNNDPLEIILNGTITSNSSEIWTLSILEPSPELVPDLHFIEDVMGRTGQAYGVNIALLWEISLDGGAFQPMTILPDNSISYIFPSGNHSFQLRITGNLQNCTADGYYKLQLSQEIIPQL